MNHLAEPGITELCQYLVRRAARWTVLAVLYFAGAVCSANSGGAATAVHDDARLAAPKGFVGTSATKVAVDQSLPRFAEAKGDGPAAETAEGGAGKEKDGGEPAVPPASAAPPITPADEYCSNVQAAASEAQAAQQRKSLVQAQQEIDKRIKTLSERTDEYRKWMKKRDDFLKLANDSLMLIYSSMKAEVAAKQLVLMNEMVAAAIVTKLSPKNAAAILSEMDAGRASRLSSMLASAGEVGEAKKIQGGEKP